MERIASFSVDHTKLKKGMYTSRVDFEDVVTYDVRMKEPNHGDYLSPGAAHTFEHLFATYARNSKWKDTIVYIGPMGCLTGCYFLAKGLDPKDAIQLVQESMAFIRDFTGDIPGAKEPECGNYKMHDLAGAKAIAADMAGVLKDWTVDDLEYEAYLDDTSGYTH